MSFATLSACHLLRCPLIAAAAASARAAPPSFSRLSCRLAWAGLWAFCAFLAWVKSRPIYSPSGPVARRLWALIDAAQHQVIIEARSGLLSSINLALCMGLSSCIAPMLDMRAPYQVYGLAWLSKISGLFLSDPCFILAMPTNPN